MRSDLPDASGRIRLWVQLAALAAMGIVAMHAVHLALGNRIAGRALARDQVALGGSIARLVAHQAADPLLVNDPVTLNEIVSGAAGDADGRVSYCFIVRGSEVVASSFVGGTPAALAAARAPGDLDPLVVRSAGARVIDLAEPILGGDLGVVRLGLDMSTLQETRRELGVDLGLLAVAVAAAGLAAAFFTGRRIAAPLGEILAAADRFDPASPEVPEVAPYGSREIAILAHRFNRMMLRLRAAHEDQARARQKIVETERLAALGQLVAGVAHEVNNPVAGLKNCLRRLERQDLTDAKRREYLGLMEEGLIRIEEVVRQLLDFGRPHPPRLERIPTSRLAREAMALVRPILYDRHVRLELLGAPVDTSVRADRLLVEQALVNLLLNAAYVTTDGGEIRLRLRVRDGLAGISVEDDGPGIPEKIRDRILHPFFSTKPEGEGTGLGLSVTRAIVDAHEGDLTFEFPPVGGTIASVWLRPADAERDSA